MVLHPRSLTCLSARFHGYSARICGCAALMLAAAAAISAETLGYRKASVICLLAKCLRCQLADHISGEGNAISRVRP